ncbi:hypothetical protein QVD17_38116 [Tagetes erecta]|uniref:Uncharacterized protein n=1 Tax=Tagetes erecta TaxID=13708 RepID=A0AAD8JZI5_TARER|nr:hypothetical protein QVD17_38116 [Tagetes erecta]
MSSLSNNSSLIFISFTNPNSAKPFLIFFLLPSFQTLIIFFFLCSVRVVVFYTIIYLYGTFKIFDAYRRLLLIQGSLLHTINHTRSKAVAVACDAKLMGCYFHQVAITLIESNRQNNNTAIPQLLLDCIGKSTKFFMQVYKNDRTNHTRYTVSKTVPVSDTIRSKMQIPNLTAPPTPQQQQLVPLQQATSTVKRQLQLIAGEGSSSKMAKVTPEMTHGSIEDTIIKKELGKFEGNIISTVDESPLEDKETL